MRPYAAIVLLALAAAMPNPVSAGRPAARTDPRADPRADSRPGAPPHAWLFGTWTGGLFPVLDGMTAQDCRTEPTVVFGQDEVDHAALTAAGMTQRVIESVRVSPRGAEFRLSPSDTDPAGFGCDGPDALHVAREGENSVSFPGCAAFPYPLQRCPRG